MHGPHDPDHPRALSDLGMFRSDALTLKAYGLCAPGQSVQDTQIAAARTVLRADVPPRVTGLGDSNGLGFAIVHPGSTGTSIGIYWWGMRSVLCQHIHRHDRATDTSLDTINRPVVACVWELAVIHHEQTAWRRHIMADRPDPDAYLRDWLDQATV